MKQISEFNTLSLLNARTLLQGSQSKDIGKIVDRLRKDFKITTYVDVVNALSTHVTNIGEDLVNLDAYDVIDADPFTAVSLSEDDRDDPIDIVDETNPHHDFLKYEILHNVEHLPHDPEFILILNTAFDHREAEVLTGIDYTEIATYLIDDMYKRYLATVDNRQPVNRQDFEVLLINRIMTSDDDIDHGALKNDIAYDAWTEHKLSRTVHNGLRSEYLSGFELVPTLTKNNIKSMGIPLDTDSVAHICLNVEKNKSPLVADIRLCGFVDHASTDAYDYLTVYNENVIVARLANSPELSNHLVLSLYEKDSTKHVEYVFELEQEFDIMVRFDESGVSIFDKDDIITEGDLPIAVCTDVGFGDVSELISYIDVFDVYNHLIDSTDIERLLGGSPV